MSKRLVFALVLMVLGTIGLSGCDSCVLVAPELVSPDLWEILSGPLEWDYDDLCVPDHFEINYIRESDFPGTFDIEIVPGSSTTFTPSGLVTGEYLWEVRAEDDGTYGPYNDVLGSFFIGPVCDPADLVAPTLIYPPEGGIYDYDYDLFDWEWPLASCIPESYRVEVSQYPDFHDAPRNEHLGNPTTAWSFGERPPDATQYFWRITPHVDGSLGPPSEIGMFYTGPICSGASLIDAVPLTPLNGETVLVGNPEFSWTYPDTSCIPEGYELRIYMNADWNDLVMEVVSPDVFATSFQPGVPFADCGDYAWQVRMISEGDWGPLHYGQRLIVDSGSCDCALGSIPIPILDRPTPYEIYSDTNVHSHWHSPVGCFPSGASYKISPDYDFADTSRDVMMTREFPGAFDPPGLEPATQYWWKVAYFEDDAGTPVLGDYSEPRSFFTGPECTSLTEVMAPEIYSPLDGEVVNTLTPALRYRPGIPGCIPDGYFLNLQIDPAFGGTNLLGGFSIPGTTVFPDPLTDCTEYFLKVNGIQDGSMGPESDVVSFIVDVDGTCGRGGVPGTAKSNFFCRKGTFEVFDPLWTIETDHRVLAIARNPQMTYVLLNVLDQNTLEPFVNEIHCWAWLGNLIPGWPDRQDDGEHSFEDLRSINPPDPPLEPSDQLVCKKELNAEDCKLAGGQYFTQNKYCQCP